VKEGFEPSIRCRIHTFQACSFSHSDTSPHCCHHSFTVTTEAYYKDPRLHWQAFFLYLFLSVHYSNNKMK
ncbi:hypothetical protein FA893_10705, partial [Photobacterium damselae subsp. piscicida]